VRRLVYFIATSLDGRIAGPDGADPTSFWPIGDDYVQYLVSNHPETLPAPARTALSIDGPPVRFDTALEGRRTYEIGLAAGLDDAYPHLRHIVYSRTLKPSGSCAVEFVADVAVDHVRELKQQQGGDIWLVGGGTLAATLYSEIDELILKLAPFTIGSGVALLADDVGFGPRTWALVDHTALPSGTLILRYCRPR
jgi:dihydrofolate reductase